MKEVNQYAIFWYISHELNHWPVITHKLFVEQKYPVDYSTFCSRSRSHPYYYYYLLVIRIINLHWFGRLHLVLYVIGFSNTIYSLVLNLKKYNSLLRSVGSALNKEAPLWAIGVNLLFGEMRRKSSDCLLSYALKFEIVSKLIFDFRKPFPISYRWTTVL